MADGQTGKRIDTQIYRWTYIQIAVRNYENAAQLADGKANSHTDIHQQTLSDLISR